MAKLGWTVRINEIILRHQRVKTPVLRGYCGAPTEDAAVQDKHWFTAPIRFGRVVPFSAMTEKDTALAEKIFPRYIASIQLCF